MRLQGRAAIEQAVWMRSRLALLPDQWQADFSAGHAQRIEANEGKLQAANLWLLDTSERWQDIRVPLNASDADICALADKCAAECWMLADVGGTVADLRGRQERYVRRWGIAAPDAETIADGPAVARMTDALWWRRGLRAIHARALEAEAIRLGYVHKRAAIYCSNETLQRRHQQKKRNAAMLESTTATNEHGDEFTLAELAARSVANPAIRRGELMLRIAGFESVARGLGDVGEFVTATCPSRMHSRLSKSGAENPKYDGTTPRQAQAYLSKVWAKCRAALARAGVAIYGFRVAEPHHDGCPHWHMLFFLGAGLVETFRAIVARYFLATDGDETGAQSNRVKFKAIDWNKGTAAGYIAKYIAKNIDGYGIDADLYGTPSLEASARVEAWAATWGIRQFQQIGGPGVGIWRELRRIKPGDDLPEEVEAARAAADKTEQRGADWGAYVAIMGGPVLERKYRPLGSAYAMPETVSPLTGEIVGGVSKYGDAPAPRMVGVIHRVTERIIKGVRFVWSMARRVKSAATGHGGETIAGNRGSRGQTGRSGVGLLPWVPIGTPWSPVNNCTREESIEERQQRELLGKWVADFVGKLALSEFSYLVGGINGGTSGARGEN